MLEIIKKLIPKAIKILNESDNPKLIKLISIMYVVGSAMFNVGVAIEKDGFQMHDLKHILSIEAVGGLVFLGYFIYAELKKDKNK